MKGELRVRLAAADGHTRVTESYAHAPFHYLPPRAFAGEPPLLTVVNSSGGVLGGDALDMSFSIGPGAAILRTQSATRIYRSESGPARCTCRFQLGANAFLDYFPDEIIPFAGSSYAQDTHVDLEGGAVMLLSEIVTAGRLARGEEFAFTRLALDVRCTGGGSPLLRDRSDLRPLERPLGSGAILHETTVWGSLYLLTTDPIETALIETVDETFRSMAEGVGGATAGPIGMVARAVGASVDTVRDALQRARASALDQLKRDGP
jgi:urease accessory protein